MISVREAYIQGLDQMLYSYITTRVVKMSICNPLTGRAAAFMHYRALGFEEVFGMMEYRRDRFAISMSRARSNVY